MDADDSSDWGLFENRPARERTSAPPSEAAQEYRRRAGGRDRLHRDPRTVAERDGTKC